MMLALPPHEEPTWLDLVGYGKDYDIRMEEYRKRSYEISLALQELAYQPAFISLPNIDDL
jgi:hypothetical protein